MNCTLVQALRLCTCRTAHRGSRGVALLFLDHGTRRGWGVTVTPRPLFTPKERLGSHCIGGWVGPRAGLDRCGKSRPQPEFDPRTVQPRSQSLCRLRYPARTRCVGHALFPYAIPHADVIIYSYRIESKSNSHRSPCYLFTFFRIC